MGKGKKTRKAPQPEASEPIELPFCRTLPSELAAPLGQVMMDWAFFEMRLQELVSLALKISVVQGRLAIKSMRALEMYQLATDLFQLEGIQLPRPYEDEFAELARRRNLLAHGVWFSDGDSCLLRDLTGTFLINGKRVKRKIQPAGVPITADNIKNLSESIRQVVSDIESLIQDVTKRRSSLRKKDPE
ncbi:MAG: hypothetical protein WBC18_14750 [Ottowia sp.]|uniref:hypothetical protein n=1 Tax=Ottowia sp. TaxID=1898956 RepID=UPI003C75C1D8